MAITDEQLGTSPVHWYEGMFLQPHHLQCMQNSVSRQFRAERHLSRAYAWGVAELQVADADLEACRIRLERLKVVLPTTRRLIEYPGNTDIKVTDFEREFARLGEDYLDIFLCVPLWFGDRANTIDLAISGEQDWRSGLAYRVRELDVPDENTGDNKKRIQLRQHNASLRTRVQPDDEMESIHLLRIRRQRDRPVRDNFFIPPLLVADGSPLLKTWVHEITAQISRARASLEAFLKKDGFKMSDMQMNQLEDWSRLRVYNRFTPRLQFLSEAPGISPGELYLELCDLYAELMSIDPTQPRNAFKIRYDHAKPTQSFWELRERIRTMLTASEHQKVFEVKMEPRTTQGDELEAELEPRHLDGTEFYIAVRWSQRAASGQETLARLVEPFESRRRIRLVPASRHRGRLGIPLSYVQSTQLPAVMPRDERHYFRIDREHAEGREMWNEILQQRKATLSAQGERVNFEAWLCIIVEQTEEPEEAR